MVVCFLLVKSATDGLHTTKGIGVLPRIVHRWHVNWLTSQLRRVSCVRRVLSDWLADLLAATRFLAVALIADRLQVFDIEL